MKKLIIIAALILVAIAGIAVYLLTTLNKSVVEEVPVKTAEKAVVPAPKIEKPVDVPKEEPAVKMPPMEMPPMGIPNLNNPVPGQGKVLPLPQVTDVPVNPLPDFTPITNSTGPVPPEGTNMQPNMEFPKTLPQITEEERMHGPAVPPGTEVKQLPYWEPGAPSPTGPTDDSNK